MYSDANIHRAEVYRLNLKSDQRRVQTAVLAYLIMLLGITLMVWVWFILHRHGPHHFPLGERSDRYGDLLRFSGKYQIGTTPRIRDNPALVGSLYPRNYPPFSVAIYLFLLQVCAPYALVTLAATVLVAAFVACTVLYRRVTTFASYRWYIGLAIFYSGVMGWATEQVIMRGNIEGFMWIAVLIGAWLFSRKRYEGAAAAFGVACCIKPYPILWFAIMLRQRRYREVGLGILTAAGVTFFSLFALDRNPLRAYQKLSGKSTFFGDYIVAFRPMDEMLGDHSLLQTMKTISRVVRYHGLTFPASESTVQSNNPLAWKLYHAYLPLAALLGVVVALGVWKKPVLNQIFAVACASTLFPLMSGDYTLGVILIPLGFFLIYMMQDVADGRVELTLGQMLYFLLPCAWLMATGPRWVLHGVLETVALLILLGASLIIPLPSTLFGEIEDRASSVVPELSV
jgi:hypothetical protein